MAQRACARLQVGRPTEAVITQFEPTLIELVNGDGRFVCLACFAARVDPFCSVDSSALLSCEQTNSSGGRPRATSVVPRCRTANVRGH